MGGIGTQMRPQDGNRLSRVCAAWVLRLKRAFLPVTLARKAAEKAALRADELLRWARRRTP